MADNAMIVYNATTAVEQVKTTREIVRVMSTEILKKDHDYGVVPGTDKPTLLKPGAEKLCTAFSLRPEFDTISSVENFDTGLFYYRIKCTLYHIPTGLAIATGIGSCSTYESKYRWRTAKRVCPSCGSNIGKSKFPDRQTGDIGFYCGACKSNFSSTDKRITEQVLGKVENPDIIDQINTVDKMAQKRALIAAVLVGTNASEFFTQDIEDLPEFNRHDVIEGEYIEPSRPQRQAPPPPPTAPAAGEGQQTQPPPATPAPAVTKPAESRAVLEPDKLISYLKSIVLTGGNNDNLINNEQLKSLAIRINQYNMADPVLRYILNVAYAVQSRTELSVGKYDSFRRWLDSNKGNAVNMEIEKLTALVNEDAQDDPAGGLTAPTTDEAFAKI